MFDISSQSYIYINGEIPLLEACSRSYTEIVKMLLSVPSIDVNVKNVSNFKIKFI